MKNIKKVVMDGFFVAGLGLLATSVAPMVQTAHAAETGSLENDLRNLVIECTVMPLTLQNQVKVSGGFHLILNGVTYELTGQVAPDADDGDLYDIQVVNLSTGQVVIQEHNDLCEGDLLFGLVHDYSLVRKIEQD
jgi:hypothetical protein